MSKKYELPFIQFLRTGVLLTALIAVPGAAVCWNIVPQDWLRHKDNVVPPLSACVFEEVEEETLQAAENESRQTENKKTETETALVSVVPVSAISDFPPLVADEPALKTAALYVPQYVSQQSTSLQSVPSVPQPSFTELEETLKQLGAKYYRLEKWGSKGGLYRFSCYVSPPGPEQYQKCFQAIDSDELRAVETVIGEIAQWRNSRN